jgi:hypothetical protein
MRVVLQPSAHASAEGSDTFICQISLPACDVLAAQLALQPVLQVCPASSGLRTRQHPTPTQDERVSAWRYLPNIMLVLV